MPIPRFESFRDASGKKRWRSYTKINDWVSGKVVPVRSVPMKYRRRYRATLLAAARAGRDCGVKLHAASSFRTYAQQVALYADYMNGEGNLAAKPGTSRHEKGNALDLYVAGNIPRMGGQAVGNVKAVKSALLRRGLVFPVSSEAWHVEYHG
jgi:hypothetical protein